MIAHSSIISQDNSNTVKNISLLTQCLTIEAKYIPLDNIHKIKEIEPS